MWALVLSAVATGVYRVDDNGHVELEHRFRLRVAIASDFVSTYVEDLGLYIVGELVEANGGTIRYEPNRPTGSRFVVELPADPARVRELNATSR